MTLFWTKRAKSDLAGIQDIIGAEQPAAARITQSVRETAELVAMWPAIGRVIGRPFTRTFAVPGTKFLLAYLMEESRVSIVALFHGAEDWQRRYRM